MSNVSKSEIIERMEDVLSYILSRKYNCKIQIHLKKGEITNGDINKTGNIREKQISHR